MRKVDLSACLLYLFKQFIHRLPVRLGRSYLQLPRSLEKYSLAMELYDDCNNQKLPDETVDVDDDDALVSFEAPLFISGDDEDTFHTKNKSLTDWHRRIIVERLTKAATIQCFLLDVLHGKLSSDFAQGEDGAPSATLMVFKFRLEPIRHGRRLVRARIDIEFFAKDREEDAAPTVLAIGLDDRWTINPTVDHEDVVKGGKLNLGLSGVPFLDAGVEASLQKTSSRDIHDATTVTGSTHFGEGIDWGEHTACGWTLLENQKRSTGLPYSFTVPVLVQRDSDKQFTAVVNLSVKGNTRTTVDWMFNKIPVDDPVLFNPAVDRFSHIAKKTDLSKGAEKRAKSTVQKYAKDELGEWVEHMDELTHVIMRTVSPEGRGEE